MNKFRMSWRDFRNDRFKYKGGTVYLYQHLPVKKTRIRTRIMFLLNIHRGRWVKTSDLIKFIYSETPLDDWPENQLSILGTSIMRLRALLPKDIKIINSHSFGYRLESKERQ